MLTNRRTLVAHGSRLHGLPTSRGLLLGLEQTLVAPLADRGFMRPLRLLEPIRSDLRSTLRPHARIHLPCTGRHVVGLLVLWVCCR